MLGIVIGSGCLVVVVTIGLSGNEYVTRQIQGIGSNIVYAYYVAPGPQHGRPLADEINFRDMEAINQFPGVLRVAGTYDIQEATNINGIERPIAVVGVTEDFQTIRNLDLLSGRFIDSLDTASRAKACVISRELAQRMGSDTPEGQTLHVADMNLTIVGVFQERVSTFGQSEITSESVIVPIGLMKYYTGNDYLKMVYAQADRPGNVAAVTAQVAALLASRHRSGAVYNVQNLAALLAAGRNISIALMIILLVIAVIALVVSGIGIMNIMLVTVTERTREIGLRMAIGARRREIHNQFLLEASLISGTGAIAGISVAVILALLVQTLLPDNLGLPISWISVVASFVTSFLTGVVFGILPARRAASLPPTGALHHE
jgi:putative ABC transport system permease protein